MKSGPLQNCETSCTARRFLLHDFQIRSPGSPGEPGLKRFTAWIHATQSLPTKKQPSLTNRPAAPTPTGLQSSGSDPYSPLTWVAGGLREGAARPRRSRNGVNKLFMPENMVAQVPTRGSTVAAGRAGAGALVCDTGSSCWSRTPNNVRPPARGQLTDKSIERE